MLSGKDRRIVADLFAENQETAFVRAILPYPRICEAYAALPKEAQTLKQRKIFLLEGKLYGTCELCGAGTSYLNPKRGFSKGCSRSCSAKLRIATCTCVHCGKNFVAGDRKAETCPSCAEKISTECDCGCGGTVKAARWRVKAGSAYMRYHHARGKTYEEIYGTDTPGCGFKKGVDNLSQRPEILAKILDARYRRKKVTVAGKVFRVQGYEGKALRFLKRKEVDVENLTNSFSDYPRFSYKQGTKIRRYFPDFINKTKKVAYEVKSTYTLFGNRTYYANMRAKVAAVLAAGYKMVVMLGYEKTGNFQRVVNEDFDLPYAQFVQKYKPNPFR